MTTIHLIRHGATATSGTTYAGRADVPLNALGRKMALRLAEALSDRPITLILSSPLRRATATAAPLARARGLDIRLEPRLMEFDFGRYEGQPKETLRLKLRRDHARHPVPGGEALVQVWDRVGQLLDEIRGLQAPGQHQMAIVGHYWVNRMLFGRAVGLDFDGACRSRDYRPKTGSIIELPIAKVAMQLRP